MTQRLRNLRPVFTDAPFASEGTSVYATVGETVQYRNLRVLRFPKRYARRTRGPIAIWSKGTGANHDLAAASILKTARRAFEADPDASIDVDLAAAGLVPGSGTQSVTFDVRTCKDDVENETDNARTVTLTIDSNGDDVTEILGTAVLLNVEVRAAGICRVRFVWTPSRDGVQPDTFTLIRTAGPTSPSNVAVSYAGTARLIEIDTEALSDASPYTFKIAASADSGATTADVLTGIAVQADATGPTAPVNGRSEAY